MSYCDETCSCPMGKAKAEDLKSREQREKCKGKHFWKWKGKGYQCINCPETL